MNLKKPEKFKAVDKQSTVYHQEEIFPSITAVECNKEEITAFLDDGRKVSIPAAWYPRTRQATLKQLKNYRLTSDHYGIHWPEIDEHLSVKAFLKGLQI